MVVVCRHHHHHHHDNKNFLDSGSNVAANPANQSSRSQSHSPQQPCLSQHPRRMLYVYYSSWSLVWLLVAVFSITNTATSTSSSATTLPVVAATRFHNRRCHGRRGYPNHHEASAAFVVQLPQHRFPRRAQPLSLSQRLPTLPIPQQQQQQQHLLDRRLVGDWKESPMSLAAAANAGAAAAGTGRRPRGWWRPSWSRLCSSTSEDETAEADSSSAAEEQEVSTATSSTPASFRLLPGKTIYQRSFYRFPLPKKQKQKKRGGKTRKDDDNDEDEDYDDDYDDDDEDDLAFLEFPQAMVIEERLRYQVMEEEDGGEQDDDDEEDDDDEGDSTQMVRPVGPRTLVLREGQVKPGKIGPAFCTIHIYDDTRSENGEEGTATAAAHRGPQPAAWRATMATALYLSANPQQFWNDQVLQLGAASGGGGGGSSLSSSSSTDYGLATVLGALGAAQALKRKAQSEDSTSGSSDAKSSGGSGGVLGFGLDDVSSLDHESTTLMFPPLLQQITLTDGDADQVHQMKRMLQHAGLLKNGGVVVVEELEWNARRNPMMMIRRRYPTKEFNTVVASDGLYGSYPEAKELARTVAHTLKAAQPFLVNVNKQREPIPRFVHLCSYEDGSSSSSSASAWYLQKVLQEGFLMSVDTSLLTMDHIQFAIQTLENNDDKNGTTTATAASLSSKSENEEEEEAALDPLVLEVQDWDTVDFRVMTAQHHPDYLGGGTGEYFFPMETGTWEQ